MSARDVLKYRGFVCLMKTIPEQFKIFLARYFILPLIFIVFLPVVDHQFLNWDDDYHVYQNRSIDRLDRAHLAQTFFEPVGGAVYFPLTIVTYSMEKHFFGLDPKIFHLNNLLLHLIVVVLVLRLGLLCGLSQPAAVGAAFIFGIHPMHVETVAWVTERKDLVYSIFYLLALIQYCSYVKDGKFRGLLLCYVLGFLSLLSKPMALSLPLVLLLLDWFFKRSLGWRLFLEKAPFVGFIPLIWITLSVLQVQMAVPSWDAIWVVIWEFAFYVRQFLFPVILTPIYALPRPIGWVNMEYMFALLVLAAVIYGIYRFRRDRWVIFAFGYFLFSIFFLLRVSTESLGHVYVTDHYMYLPSLGICFLFGELWDRYTRDRAKLGLNFLYAATVVVLVLAALAWKSSQQVMIWRDNFTFWDHVLKHNPTLDVGYLNRGMAYAQAGKYKQALKDLDQAIALNRTNVEAFNNRANVHGLLGDHRMAVEDHTQAIVLEIEKCARIHCPKDNTSTKQDGKIFHKVSRYNAQLAKLLTNRARAHFALNDDQAALADLNEACRMNPYLFDIYLNRGRVYKKLSQWEGAADDLTRAIELAPRSTAAHMERFSLFFQRRDFHRALASLDRILSYDPANAEAWYYKFMVYREQGNWRSAWEHLSKARDLGYAVSPQELTTISEAARIEP